jgi:toxin ParE1/3/4
MSVGFKIVWSDDAQQDLDRITEYYLERAGLRVAEDIFVRIKAQIAALKDFPNRCRPGQVQGTKEYIISRLPYMVVVEITEDMVSILSVVHTSRKYPPEIL